MPSSHSNIFNDSRIKSTSRVLSKDLIEVVILQIDPIIMSVFVGIIVISWAIFLNNGIHAQEEVEEFHPRKNLGLASRQIHSHHQHILPHYHHHRHHQKNDDELPKLRNLDSILQPKDFSSYRDRRKRHNNKRNKALEQELMTSEEERDYQESKKQETGLLEKSEDYEVEVKEAQNKSICDYKVVPIPDLEGNRIPADLEHVVCNHAGSKCQSLGSHYCLQTYRMIDVYYGKRRSKMKIYAGCVCALFDLPFIKPQPVRLSLDF